MRPSFCSNLATAVLAAAPFLAVAQPGISYRYGPPPKMEIIEVTAIVDLEEAMTDAKNCEQRIADLVIDEVVYEGTSEIVTGFRALKPGVGTKPWYALFEMDTKALYRNISNSERRNVQMLIRKGAKIIVSYQVCGSGGFISVRDVFLKSAVNNP